MNTRSCGARRPKTGIGTPSPASCPGSRWPPAARRRSYGMPRTVRRCAPCRTCSIRPGPGRGTSTAGLSSVTFRRMKPAALLLGVLILVLPSLALSSSPINTDRAEEFSRAALCSQGHNVYVDSAYPWLVGTSTGGAQLDEDNPPMLFRWGDLVTVSCDAAVVGAWVMSTDPGVLTSTTGWISDTDTTRPGGDADGIGGAFKGLATSYRDQTVWRGEIGSPVGLVSQRTKGCSSSVAAKNAAVGG